MNGATVVAAGVPYGTTLTYISANSAILSANATATSPGTPANIFAQNWVATALGTITLNGAVNASDGFAVVASWRWVRVNVTTLTGTTFSLQFIAGF